MSQLALLDLNSFTLFFLSVPSVVEVNGFTGTVVGKNYIYTISQERDNPKLIRYTAKQLGDSVVAEASMVRDPHSMAIRDGRLYVCSTGTNSIEMYGLDNLEYLGRYWQHPGTTTGGDQVHLNSIFIHKNDIWCSAFGRKTDDKWSSGMSGYLINTTNNLMLYKISHPHSAMSDGKSIYYCESRTGKVYRDGKEQKKIKGAYVRGLAINNELLAVGISSSRKMSRSKNTVNNPSEIGRFKSMAGIMLVGRQDNKSTFCDLSQFFTEIYDLTFIDDFKITLPEGIAGVNQVKLSKTLRENHLMSTLINENEAVVNEFKNRGKQIELLERRNRAKNKHIKRLKTVVENERSYIKSIESSRLYKMLLRIRQIKEKIKL